MIPDESYPCFYPCKHVAHSRREWIDHQQTVHKDDKLCPNVLEFNIEDPEGRCPFVSCDQWKGHPGPCRALIYEWTGIVQRMRADPALHDKATPEQKQMMGTFFKITRDP